jgi:putative transposase
MPAKKHIIALTPEQKSQLEIVARSYRHSQRERNRAKVLLLTDANREGGCLPDAQIAAQVGCQPLTVSKIRQRAAERGIVASLERKEQERRKARRLDGAGEAQLVTLACSQAPEGRKRWTMQLLKERLRQMEVVETIDEATICRTLKKTRLNRG